MSSNEIKARGAGSADGMGGAGGAARIIQGHGRRVIVNRGFAIGKGLFRFLFLLGMSFVLLYPVLFLLSNAFRDMKDILDPSVIWIPKHFTLRNFQLAISTLGFFPALKRTLVILIPSVTIQVFICMMVGYGFARFKFREREPLFYLLLFTIIVPIQTIIIPVYVNFRFFDFFGIGRLIGLFTGRQVSVNLLNTPWTFYTLSLFGMGIRSGLYIFIFRQFFRNVPVELEEAARIDGCGPFATYFRIMIPNVTSVILTVALFSVVWHWNDYYESVMFFQNEFPLSVSLTMLQDLLSVISTNVIRPQDLALIRSSVLEAASLLVTAPILILYLVTQKFFTESIQRTGIVG
jgi:multiple sugar transport system permease protein